MTDNKPSETGSSSKIERIKIRLTKLYEYCTDGVWTDTRHNWKVSLVKTLNLTVRSFMDPDFQNLAAAMTYRTVLAIVPMLAMLFAICRGFGFENMLTEQLYSFFPSQREALTTAMRFVDSYLAQASEGVFVGVGIVFLLWTVISLLSAAEDSFNMIWNVKTGRTLWRKVTDYLGIFIVLPTLIICSSGITLVLDTTLKKLLPFEALTPAISFMFEVLSVVLTWIFFAATYMLIPCAKVKLKNAAIAGALAGTAYCVLQWLFVSGQMYVAKYNAIYGSFSFLPLMLIWLQLVWLFTFIGATVCYASQNFDRFNFETQIKRMSLNYYQKCVVAITVVVAKRFQSGQSPINADDISEIYRLPIRITEAIVGRMVEDGIFVYVVDADGKNTHCVQPASDVSKLTLGHVLELIDTKGYNDFIPDFKKNFEGVDKLMDTLNSGMVDDAGKTLLTSIKIDKF